MTTYFATFIPGFSKITEKLVRTDFPDCKNIKVYESSIQFDTAQSYESLATSMYFNTVFQVLNKLEYFENQQNGSIVKAVTQNTDIVLDRAFTRAKTIRFMVQKGSAQIHIPAVFTKLIVKEIVKKTGLKINPLKADAEFWVLLRTEGFAIFGVRSTTIKAIRDFDVNAGQLRPKMAYLLNAMSEPNKDDIYLDPFAGYGSLPRSRAYHFPYAQIFALDIGHVQVKNLAQILEKHDRVKVVRDNALVMRSIPDDSITKIVTDPPWGLYNMENADFNDFYTNMLTQMVRVTKSGAIIVVLVAQHELFDMVLGTFKDKISILEKVSTLVNGKKAKVFKLQRVV